MKFTTTGILTQKTLETKEKQSGEEYQVWKCTIVTSETTTNTWNKTYKKVNGLRNINVSWEALCYNLQNLDEGDEVEATLACEIWEFIEKETNKTVFYNRISLLSITPKQKKKAGGEIKEDVF